MNFREAAAYLGSLINYEQKKAFPYKKSFKLKRILDFLEILHNPQRTLRCLHIAGTKGKGSVCAYTAYILREAGYRVGLYTSPHLVDCRERIRVLCKRGMRDEGRRTRGDFEGMISKRDFTDLVNRLKPKIQRYNKKSKCGQLTFFEAFTALAFLYFKEKKVDYAVLETGLGGRLDATNTIEPLVCAITAIDYDHIQELGKTILKIAKEKAGIIKSSKLQVPSSKLFVISAPQRKEARKVIRSRCKEKGARLYMVGKDITFKPVAYRNSRQVFNVNGLKRNYARLETSLLGSHQLENAALAIGLIEALDNKFFSPACIKRGIKNTLWPGRMELSSKRPLILLDGAQNVISARTLKSSLRKYFNYKALILILGISADKDIKGICKILCPGAQKLILTKSSSPRAADPMYIAKIAGGHAYLTHNVQDAISKAKEIAHRDDLIMITGSLFVVAEAMQILKG